MNRVFDLEAIREQRAAERAGQTQAIPADIADCPLCDDDGYRPNLTICNHNPDQDAINARGIAHVRAVLNQHQSKEKR